MYCTKEVPAEPSSSEVKQIDTNLGGAREFDGLISSENSVGLGPAVQSHERIHLKIMGSGDGIGCISSLSHIPVAGSIRNKTIIHARVASGELGARDNFSFIIAVPRGNHSPGDIIVVGNRMMKQGLPDVSSRAVAIIN